MQEEKDTTVTNNNDTSVAITPEPTPETTDKNTGKEPAPATNPESKPTPNPEPAKEETKPADGQEDKPQDELTLESYGDLGIVETEDIKINKEMNEAFKNIALKHKISPEAAKEIAALQYEQVKKDVENLKNLKKAWEEENQKTYGDNLKNIETKCGRVLTELDKDGKFQAFLSLVGAQKAPATIEFLSKVGDAILEKGSVNPDNKETKEKELSDIF